MKHKEINEGTMHVEINVDKKVIAIIGFTPTAHEIESITGQYG